MRMGICAFIHDLDGQCWRTRFLGALLAVPAASVLGVPLLILLLLLFGCNPGGLGTYMGNWKHLRDIPGFRSGRRAYMAVASLLYLLPLSLLGMVVVCVDGMLLGLWS